MVQKALIVCRDVQKLTWQFHSDWFPNRRRTWHVTCHRELFLLLQDQLLKDKDDRISLLETQMAAQQAGYEAQRRLNQQMMEMMQRMYPNEVFPDVPDP
ncbi:hypothetical protein F2Q68_00007638 [Brassica cretica]|uniref:Uncharacterized protein n=1 Tax=Brassica cretica TaxID=69181 RepID=A0A8S9L0B0_BRACR|nr:hypothetical protein F2Q68_00007638 [Brassica cretica]